MRKKVKFDLVFYSFFLEIISVGQWTTFYSVVFRHHLHYPNRVKFLEHFLLTRVIKKLICPISVQIKPYQIHAKLSNITRIS